MTVFLAWTRFALGLDAPVTAPASDTPFRATGKRKATMLVGRPHIHAAKVRARPKNVGEPGISDSENPVARRLSAGPRRRSTHALRHAHDGSLATAGMPMRNEGIESIGRCLFGALLEALL
jgi:hypothetical protein